MQKRDLSTSVAIIIAQITKLMLLSQIIVVGWYNHVTVPLPAGMLTPIKIWLIGIITKGLWL